MRVLWPAPFLAGERVYFAPEEHEVHVRQRLDCTATLGDLTQLEDRFGHPGRSRPPEPARIAVSMWIRRNIGSPHSPISEKPPSARSHRASGPSCGGSPASWAAMRIPLVMTVSSPTAGSG